MGYNAIDIIDKCIAIENKKMKVLETIANSNDSSAKVKIVVKVLEKEVDRTIKYYYNIKMELEEINNLADIDFRSYDKISFLMNEYIRKIDSLHINANSSKMFLETFLDLSKDKKALLVDIQGRLFNNMKVNDKTYKILSQIISFSNYEIRTIIKTIK